MSSSQGTHEAEASTPERTPEHATRFDGFVMGLALTSGLFVSWWAAFHEIACGGISIRLEVPLPYTYMSCYAHAIGCILGAALTRPILHGARRLAGERAGTMRLVYATGAALLVFTLLFFLCLGYDAYLAAALIQTLINALAIVPIILGIAMLSQLALSNATLILFACLATSVLVNNVALPLVIYLGGALIAVLPVLVAMLGLSVLCLHRTAGRAQWGPLARRVHDVLGLDRSLVKGPSPLIADRPTKDDDATSGVASSPSARAAADSAGLGAQAAVHLPWQPLLHLAIYSLLFGMMHVEASSLIVGFFDRNLPYTAGALLAVALFYGCFMRASASSFVWPRMRTVVFPLTTASFLMLPLLGGSESYLPVTSINGASLFYDMALVLALLYVARETSLGIVSLARIAIGVKMAFFLLGTVLCHLEINLLSSDILQEPTSTLAAFLLLMAGTIWVGDDYQARKVWGLRLDRGPRNPQKVELQAKCNYLARRYHLTPKEREIAQLLVEGRRVGQIAEEMMVSVNTTRTHVRNLYASVGVHSFKELDALVQAIDPAEAYSVSA
ncbi:MAG: hypothetical protein KHY83_09255 [Coriobacteriia bacterium]|nr:hypothetical protein [Coriobacteriia bacterium]MBS5478833.1 hypothetical protein [Coriobacteriia bacterium]